jgi:hypothetical protein
MILKVIFCVMMVFILQAVSLMKTSRGLQETWHKWEGLAPRGTSQSVERKLMKAGYLDAHGEKKNDFPPIEFWKDFRAWGGIRPMCVYHGIRYSRVLFEPGEAYDPCACITGSGILE